LLDWEASERHRSSRPVGGETTIPKQPEE
jgi:hypothetical protein